MDKTFPTFSSLAEARRIVEQSQGAAALVTAPFAARACGPLYLMQILDILRGDYPGRPIDAVIDCGQDSGLVLAALDIGWRRVRFAGDAAMAVKLADIARQYGAKLEQS